MLTPTGIITPVRVNELIPRECFCMLYAQWVNLFGMRSVLCNYLLPAPYITMCDFPGIYKISGNKVLSFHKLNECEHFVLDKNTISSELVDQEMYL